jgi:hypothetical protein
MLRTNQNQNTVSYSATYFISKIVPFMRYVETYRTPGDATVDNMANAHLTLGT